MKANSINYGGPAFPQPVGCGGESPIHCGMSLRAYIATAVLAGYAASTAGGRRQAAEIAVAYADALIEELEKVK